MESEWIAVIERELKQGRKVAQITIIDQEGQSPRGVGTFMVLTEGGQSYGTVGGGRVEWIAKTEGEKCLAQGICKVVDVAIAIEEGKHNQETGQLKLFVKTYCPANRLVIFGAGHVGYHLYELASLAGFSVTVVDERSELLSRERYSRAEAIYLGNPLDQFEKLRLDEHTYVVVTSGTTEMDKQILKVLMGQKLKYMGMLGSKKKTQMVKAYLRDQGIGEETLEGLYAPVGIDLGGETPQEVAVSILAELQAVKNNKEIIHLKKTQA